MTRHLRWLGSLWLIAFAVVAFQSGILHRGYPYNTLLYIPDSQFSDFTVFYKRFAIEDRAAFFSAPGFPFTYPAPLLICFRALWESSQPLAVYLALVFAFAFSVAVAGLRTVRGVGFAASATIATAVFSFPFFFLIDRANLEGFVWIATAAGLFCFVRRRYYAAAVLLGLATSMKLFPAVLLLIFLPTKRYREFGASLLSCAAFTVASLWAAGPSMPEAARGIAAGFAFQRDYQVLQWRPSEIGFDHSLFAALKLPALLSPGGLQPHAAFAGLYIPYALAAVLGFAVIYGLRLRRMPILNQILALSAISVTLPFVAYEYGLVHLIVPFILLVLFLVRDGARALNGAQIGAILLPFAFIFAPMSYVLLFGVGLGGLIKTGALLCVVRNCLVVPLPSSMFGELGAASSIAAAHEIPRAV